MNDGIPLKMRLKDNVYQMLLDFEGKLYWCSIRYDGVHLYYIIPESGKAESLSREQTEFFKRYEANMKYSLELLGEYMDFT